MGFKDTRSDIRVRKTKLIKDLNLPGGHFCRLGIALVIETEQVQHPMDRHVRPMRFT
jgi:hypothetical protein